jgi:hypothetical protein
VELDFNAEVIGDGLYCPSELGIGGPEIVIFQNSIRSSAVGALNGIQLCVHASWLKALEDKTVGIAVGTI